MMLGEHFATKKIRGGSTLIPFLRRFAENGLISSAFFHHQPPPSTWSEANTTRWNLMVFEQNCAICHNDDADNYKTD